MKIIFRADDLGFSEGVNCGIYRAVKDGPITCTGLRHIGYEIDRKSTRLNSSHSV